MTPQLDRLLAQYCSATLVGVKSACLVSCCRQDPKEVLSAVESYNRALNRSGLLFRLYENRVGCPLLFVYRPALLWQRLQSESAAQLLTQAGYPTQRSLKDCLDRLGQRLSEEEFPHEIGLFLDYPPDDVTGYLANGGRDCKVCGYWKVYSNVERATRLFRLYDACRDSLLLQLDTGRRIVDLTFPQRACLPA